MPRVIDMTGMLGPAHVEAAVVAASEDGHLRVHMLTTLYQFLHHPYEFGRLEGLGKKGVDPDVEPALDLVLGTGADDGEGKIAGPRIGAKPSRSPQPVEPRHHDIERDHIGLHLMHDVQTLGTVGGGHDLETLQLEVDPDQLPDDLVVVHNKHPTERAWHNSRVGRPRAPRPGFPYFRPVRGRGRRRFYVPEGA